MQVKSIRFFKKSEVEGFIRKEKYNIARMGQFLAYFNKIEANVIF